MSQWKWHPSSSQYNTAFSTTYAAMTTTAHELKTTMWQWMQDCLRDECLFGSIHHSCNHFLFSFSHVLHRLCTQSGQLHLLTDKKLSYCWQTVYRSVKVTKYSTIPYVRYSLLCNSNLVFKTCHFHDIRLQKCRDLENRVRGPSMSLDISPFHSAHRISYWRSTVTMALSRVVSGIFNVEKCHELEFGVRGHSRSSSSIIW